MQMCQSIYILGKQETTTLSGDYQEIRLQDHLTWLTGDKRFAEIPKYLCSLASSHSPPPTTSAQQYCFVFSSI